MRQRFGITANGNPIQSWRLDRTPVRIRASFAFEEESARLHMGLSKAEYDALPGTRDWIGEEGQLCKADVVAFYRATILIPAVMSDAQVRAMKRSEFYGR